MIPYLQMVHLCKLYQDDQETLEEMKVEQQACSELVGLDHSNKKKLMAYQKITESVTAMEHKLD